jgi:hypothetical protein
MDAENPAEKRDRGCCDFGNVHPATLAASVSQVEREVILQVLSI